MDASRKYFNCASKLADFHESSTVPAYYTVSRSICNCIDQWGYPDTDGRIILRWIFKKWEGVVGTGWSCLRIGTGGGHL